MTAPVEYWATEELPGTTWNPEPPDDDEPGIETVNVTGDLL